MTKLIAQLFIEENLYSNSVLIFFPFWQLACHVLKVWSINLPHSHFAIFWGFFKYLCLFQLLFYCCDETTLPKTTQLTFLAHHSSCKDVNAGAQAGAEKQNHRGILLTGSLTGSCSASFLIQPWPICLGMVPPTVG